MEDKQIMTVYPIKSPADSFEHRPFSIGTDQSSNELPQADVQIVTSGGLSFPAHSIVLASFSSVLENNLDRTGKRRNSEKIIPILGVPCDAVQAFVRFLYSFRCTEEEMDKYGIHLLVLSHVLSVRQLKRRCTIGLAGRLTVENVVDMLQLARLCDAPDLYLKGMKLISNDYKTVGKTEGWNFLQNHDPWLELEILQFIDEAESLSEAMECLEHIFTEGCTSVGPNDKVPTKSKGPCKWLSTCRGLQLLIRHFAVCDKKVNGGCCRCKRMWQLLRLHSFICDNHDFCRVPLCRQFKQRTRLEKKRDDARWRLLARKVVSAKAISSLSLPKRKREVESRERGTLNSL